MRAARCQAHDVHAAHVFDHPGQMNLGEGERQEGERQGGERQGGEILPC